MGGSTTRCGHAPVAFATACCLPTMDPASSALLRSLAGPQARVRLIAIPSDEAHVLVQIALRRCLRLALPLASNTCAGNMPEAARSPGQVVEHAWVRVARETIGPEGQVVPQQAAVAHAHDRAAWRRMTVADPTWSSIRRHPLEKGHCSAT